MDFMEDDERKMTDSTQFLTLCESWDLRVAKN